MAQIIKIKRSSSTALTSGVSTLNFGELAVTNIAGVIRHYVGNSSNVAIEIAGDAYAKLASPAFTGTPTAPTASAGTNSTQLATTEFVTTALGNAYDGLSYKASVRVATTANVDLTSALVDGATIDGVTVATGDRVLVLAQTDETENGIYVVVASGAASRSTDADSDDKVAPGMSTFVSEGTANGDKRFTLITDAPIVLGDSDLIFTETSGTGQIVAGNALSKTGNTLNVNVDDSSIEISSDALQVKSGGITNSHLAGSITDDKLEMITTADKVAGSAIIKSGALKVGEGDLYVAVDDVTIEVNGSDDLAIKDEGITPDHLSTSVAGDGITGGAGNALSVVADATGGANLSKSINVSSNGVAVKVDAASIIQGTSDRLEVGTIDAGTF